MKKKRIKYAQYTINERVSLVKECFKSGNSIRQVAYEYDIPPSTLYGWVKNYEKKGSVIRVSNKDATASIKAIIGLTKAGLLNGKDALTAIGKLVDKL